ncbi:hypothetical protein CsSME_00037005 [Camellia sinensis var. sinensis]
MGFEELSSMLKGGVVPCLMMVTMEACNIVLTIKASPTMSREGMSPFVFVAYANILSSVLLLPSSFLFHNHRLIFLPFQLDSEKKIS